MAEAVRITLPHLVGYDTRSVSYSFLTDVPRTNDASAQGLDEAGTHPRRLQRLRQTSQGQEQQLGLLPWRASWQMRRAGQPE